VEVTLTTAGHEVLEKWAEQQVLILPEDMRDGAKIRFMNMSTVSLWKLVQIFGPHQTSGPQLFVDNQITIRRTH